MKKLILLSCVFFLQQALSLNAQANALHFDGSNDVVTVPATNMPVGSSARTYEMWVFREGTDRRGLAGFDRDMSGNIDRTAFGMEYTPEGYLNLWGHNDDPDLNNINPTLKVTTGVWTHVAYTYDGTTLKGYINGTLVGTKPIALNTFSSPLLIGKSPYSFYNFFNGKLDEFRVWNVARTQTEIQANMNSELSTGTGLVAAYHFNQGIAGVNNVGITTLIDSKGSNTGILNNFALTGSTSNWVVGTTISSTIAITTGSQTICSGTNVSFSAIPSNTTTTAVYQWKKNGNNVGTNSATYTDALLANNDIITCILTSESNLPVSNSLTMTVNALPTPTFTTQAGSSICVGIDATYTTESGKSNYVWSVPGILNTDYSITSGGIGTSSYTVTLKWLTTGSKTVTINYTNANSCTAASATSSTATTVSAAPTVPNITGSVTVEISAITTLANTTTGGVWSSSNTAIATVDASTGVVTGVAVGSVTISYAVTNSCGTTTVTKALTVNSQTYCLTYKPVRDGNFVDVYVNMKGSTSFKLGDGNIQLLYNSAALSNPTLKSFSLTGYSNMTVTSPSPSGLLSGDAVASLNFLLESGTGKTISTATEGTEIGIIRFEIKDETKSVDIRPYEDNAATNKTLIYDGGASRTRVLSTAGCAGSYNFTTNTKLSYSAAAFCKSAASITPIIVGETTSPTYSSTTGLKFVGAVINNSSTTGEIDAAGSDAGTYMIIYTANNRYASFIVTIHPATTATITDLTGFDYCPSLAEFDLTANVSPTGGTSAYTIDGFSRTKLNPSALSTGNHNVVLTYTDLNGCSTTATQTVIINAIPSITTQPVGSTVCAGTQVLLSVVAKGKDGTTSAIDLTYAWKKVGSSSTIATTREHILNSTSVPDAGQYYVEVSGKCPSPVTSGNATVVVNTVPVITQHPKADVAGYCAGVSIELSVTATGTKPFSYQWKKDGSAIATGGTSDKYTTTVDASKGGNYTVEVSNVCQSSTAPIVSGSTTVIIHSVPSITTPPAASTVVCGGSPIVLNTVSSSPVSPSTSTVLALSYQWKKDGSAISSATTTSYSIATTANDPSPSPLPSGNYTVDVTNRCGTTSSTAAVTVNYAPEIKTQPKGSTVCVGQTFNLGVVATGTALTYQWEKGDNIIVAANSTGYSATASEVGSAGEYKVKINSGTCPALVTSSSVNIVVNIPPAITTQPQNATACVGAAINLSVATTGTALTYQWKKGSENIMGATKATYDIKTSALADAGSYSVVVSGTCSPSISVPSNAAAVVVNALPAITQLPAASASPVCAGTNVTLNVGATGSNLTFQWLKNGAAVSGASATSSYTITNSQASDAGTYSVVIGGVCASNTPYGNAVVDVHLLPSAITGNPSVNVGFTTTLGSNAHGGTGVWTISQNGTTPPTYATITSLGVVEGKIAGTATVTYTVTNACGTTPMTQLITVVENTVVMSLKVFLEGPYSVSRGLMTSEVTNPNFDPTKIEVPSNLTNTGNIRYRNDFKPTIPATSPYGSGEVIPDPTTVKTVIGNNEIIDWVLIELRNKTNPASVQYMRSALLQSDGDIVDVDGKSPVAFTKVVAGDYYISVKHRSHLGFRTVGAIALTSTSTPLDFTGSETGIYKVDPSYSALKKLSNGVYAMFAGDANSDGAINVFDKNNVWLPVNGTNPNYHKADYNLDGAVGQSDENSYRLPNDSRVQQIEN